MRERLPEDPEATALEATFSLVATTSLAMLGIDVGINEARFGIVVPDDYGGPTTDTGTFVDGTLDNPDVARMIDRVEVRTDRGLGHTQARVELRANGHSLEEFHDTGIPATDLRAQGAKLAAKMTGLTAPLPRSEVSDRLQEVALRLETVADVRGLAGFIAGSREAACGSADKPEPKNWAWPRVSCSVPFPARLPSMGN